MCALCRQIYNYSTNKLFGPTNLCTDNIKPVLWVCGILAREKLINLIGYFSNNFSLISIAIGRIYACVSNNKDNFSFFLILIFEMNYKNPKVK